MRFGICTSIEHAPAVKSAGWDYVEPSVQDLLKGDLPDAQWTRLAQARACPLPILSANCLVPGPLKITGPRADLDKLRPYIENVARRAAQVGMKVLVFGSGGARQVAEGFDRQQARQQIIAFARMASEITQKHNVMLVVEALCRAECNIINTIAEAMDCVRAVNHPNFQCLLDTYHLWIDDEPESHVADAIQSVRHVHLADRDGRVAPGLSGTSDYRPLFRLLKSSGYDGLVSVEALKFDIAATGRQVLEFLRKQWRDA